jgi:hypothetical protein
MATTRVRILFVTDPVAHVVVVVVVVDVVAVPAVVQIDLQLQEVTD